MPEVIKIGITEKNNQKIQEVKTVKVIANQGIVGDRHFKEFNDPFNQLSLNKIFKDKTGEGGIRTHE